MVETHLDPLVGLDVMDGDSGLWNFQQNLEFSATGILTRTDTDGDHPTGAVFTWEIDKSIDIDLPNIIKCIFWSRISSSEDNRWRSAFA